MRAPLLLAVSVACCLLAARPSAAEEKKLTADEIQKAFAGKTGPGIWGQTEYDGFFDANGATDYTTTSGTDRGHRRAAHDQYCSQWQMSGESCYDICRDGDRVIRVVPSSGTRYDSALISGQATAVFR